MKAYKHYLVLALMMLVAVNNVEGLTFGLVLQNIKADLALSDTQLGLLTGIAFAAFYALMGIPLGRWADRADRVLLISVTQLIWGVMIASCALARSFGQLLVVRAGVAIGEAGCIPPAHSLLAEAYNRAERPRAAGILMLAAPVSMAIGYVGTGWLNQFYGWRRTFWVLGAVGLVTAALAWLTLREPRRSTPGASGGAGGSAAPALGVWAAWRTLWSNRTFRSLLHGYSVSYFFGYGLAQWQSAYFIRHYGLQTGPLGTALALVAGTGGFIGTLGGGLLGSRFAAGNEHLQLRSISIGYVAFGLISSLIYLSGTYRLALLFVGLSALGGAATCGPLFAALQTLVPERMRALSIAIVYFFANLIGMGLGPLAAGALSDALRPAFGNDSLRYALIALCPGYLWSAWQLWRASETVMGDVERVGAAADVG